MENGCLAEGRDRKSIGLCYNTSQQATNYIESFDNDNGCPTSTKLRCLSGKCVRSTASCGEQNGCNDPRLPVKIYFINFLGTMSRWKL